MSPNINSFVGDLVAMAQAMEELPKAQDRIADLERQLAEAQRHNQGLEINISEYKNTIAETNQRLNDVVKAKDDIELRVMEMEDRNTAVSRFLGSLMGDATSLRNAIDPPKTEPIVAQPEPEVPTTNPVVDHVDITAQYPSETTSDSGTHMDRPTESVGHPFEGNGGGMSQPLTPEAPIPNPTPYANLMYEDYPHWVSRAGWKAGGGTDYTYDYRKEFGPDQTL